MEIIFVASEAFPFAKSGGLGDVVGSLPQALRREGAQVSVMLPLYQGIGAVYREQMTEAVRTPVAVGWRQQPCRVFQLQHREITYYFLENDYYFDRPNLYGYYDEAERFAFFSRAVLEVIPLLGLAPHILHCHDWHTGPVSVLLKAQYGHLPCYGNTKTVFTIHNLKFQGVFPKEVLKDLLGLDDTYYREDGLEFHQGISFMKGALLFSDRLTTVSPTYAQEIQTAFFGEKLDGVLREQGHRLTGIVNGIDQEEFDPETDPHITAFTAQSLQKKKKNKGALQRELGLEETDRPLLAMVTRLTAQKGLDLVAGVLEELLRLPFQWVVLGSGEERYESLFRELSHRHPEQVAVRIAYDHLLAHRIYAASDLFLMPSLFEPCGIGQLIAMRYGSLPIVRETGGLKDTIVPYNEFNKEGYGFSFAHYNAHDMLYTIERALGFYQNKRVWNRLVRKAMAYDSSWDQSAKAYLSLYGELATE